MIPAAPKIEIEGKLLPILRSGIPQSIQLAAEECELPSLAEYFSHFSSTKFIKKPPYLHNYQHSFGNGLYPNVIYSGKKYNPLHHLYLTSGKDSTISLVPNQPPPPPPPPFFKIKEENKTSLIDNIKTTNPSETILNPDLNENADTEQIVEDVDLKLPVKINDQVAPISIPPIGPKDYKHAYDIAIATKLRPPPRYSSYRPIQSSDAVVEVSDSVAPDSIPEAANPHNAPSLISNYNYLHHPAITTTYYNVVNENKETSGRLSLVSRPRPWSLSKESPAHFDSSHSINSQQYSSLDKFSTHKQIHSNGYMRYPGSFLSSQGKKTSYHNWPSTHSQQQHPLQYHQHYGTPPSSHPYHPQQSYLHQNPVKSHTQIPYHRIVNQYPTEVRLETFNETGSPVEYIKGNIKFNGKIKMEGSESKSKTGDDDTDAAIMGKDSSMKRVTMHHLSSDEQLTILKVNPEEGLEMNSTDVKKVVSSQEDSPSSRKTLKKDTEEVGIAVLDTNATESVNFTLSRTKQSYKTQNNETLHISNDTFKQNQGNNGDEKKVDYIVLHKLPNGEALDLENMKTYSMADLKNEMARDKQKNPQDHEKYLHNSSSLVSSENRSETVTPVTRLSPPPSRSDMPRSLNFSSNKDLISSVININVFHNTSITKKVTNNDVGQNATYINLRSDETIPEFLKFKDGVRTNKSSGVGLEDDVIQSYMSETPEGIDKLKELMMKESGSIEVGDSNNEFEKDQKSSSPMYIITEEDYMKHKSILHKQNMNNKDGSDKSADKDIILNSTHADGKNKQQEIDNTDVSEEMSSIEFLPMPKKLTLLRNNSSSDATRTEIQGDIDVLQVAVDDAAIGEASNSNLENIGSQLEYHWTPLPDLETTTSEYRVYGPQLPPEGYPYLTESNRPTSLKKTPIDIGEIDELSKIAYLTLTDNSGELITNIREAQETNENANTTTSRNSDVKEIVEKDIESEMNEDDRNPLMNVQLLPPRLSAVLSHVGHHLPQRPSLASSLSSSASSIFGSISSKERSINPYGPYINIHQHRQNKIAPIFKEDEIKSYRLKHTTPSPSHSQELPFGYLSETISNGKPSFPLRKPYYPPPPANRPIGIPANLAEPRSYALSHGRQNNARRINYPTKPSINQYVPSSSPYQTQIVPGSRETPRYIPLHETTKKHPLHPSLRWRSRLRGGGYHSRKPNHKRFPQHFNAKMLQSSPTYSSVEISRSNRREDHPNIKADTSDDIVPLEIKLAKEFISKNGIIEGHKSNMSSLPEDLLVPDGDQNDDNEKIITENGSIEVTQFPKEETALLPEFVDVSNLTIVEK